MNIQEHRPQLQDFFQTRRQFLGRFGMGMGALGLATMLPETLGNPSAALQQLATASPSLPRKPHFPVKAKRVIHIFAQGGPTHLDTWDPKPGMAKFADTNVKEIGGVPLPSPFKFTKMGKCGTEVCEVFPKIGESIDEVAVVRSMHTDIPSHEFATVMMNTGSGRMVKPSMGSWLLYGLGTDNQNLPGFIALGGGLGGAKNWRSGFLPGAFQGTLVSNTGGNVERAIENIKNYSLTLEEQRQQMDLLAKLNAQHKKTLEAESALEARIQSFELAFKMQTAATDAFDLTKENTDMRALYGATQMGDRLLTARRLVERGVRFVQVWHNGWDHHQDVKTNVARRAGECDQPIGALLKDLKQRGLLDETLVVWGGEFGRTPRHDRGGRAEPGRDHHHRGFSMWLAGGGVRRGVVHGATDEFGYDAVKDKVHVHDLHATVLKLMGFDHEKLTYRHNGRDFRLTDVYGNVVGNLIA